MRRWYCLFSLFALAARAVAADPTPEQAAHFENKVRPLLVEHCYSCHSAKTPKHPKGGLRVDGRKFLLAGGDTGPSLVPGDPAKSRFIQAVKYGDPDLLMPPKGKLPPAAVAELEAWVKAGAPWPNDTAAVAEPTNEFDLAQRKKDHWAWQPVTKPAVPAGPGDAVDRFLRAKLAEKKLDFAPATDKLTWLRRVTFALTGLPPTPADIAAFEADTSPKAFEVVVDRLLAAPAFGERWARHWLDLVRYAETRGHEFEPEIPNAYQYRDYVIRALNADVPYDRFALEHLAGDVLPDPRLDPKTGVNESVIGSGFWHLGEEVHSPVDIRQDQADRFDNRIDVLSKTFLGLTVACARCHDHKFDAIGTADYYALFGLLEGSAYRQVRIDGWAKNRQVANELAKVQAEFLGALTREGQAAPVVPPKFVEWLAKSKTVIDYANLKPGQWFPDDVTFGDGPRPAGTVRVINGKITIEPVTAAVFDRFWADFKLAPNTAKDSQGLGRAVRAGFSIRTPVVPLEKKRLHYLVRGGGMAFAAVGQTTVIAGPLHGSLIKSFPNADEYRWVTHDLSGYIGQKLHVEFTADPRTEFAVAMVVQSDDAPPAVPFKEMKPKAVPELEKPLAELAAKEKELAKQVVWESHTALALWDGNGVESPVFIRGNPRTPGPLVPHRSLEAIHGTKPVPHTAGSGRLELARQWVDPKTNPFFTRVFVNRAWHHLFGRGLVASVDNFGLLGEKPTHPELLDSLATEFATGGFKLKPLLRRLVLTDAYRMSSTGSASADDADPANLLLHEFRVRRLDGESIRDAMLSVSGRLKINDAGGPGTLIHLTPFLDGRGRPGSGAVDGGGRRSVYLAVRRNFLNPFFQAFDTPIPFSTVGRRQVSNVPAQALILLNDPLVHQQADVWAKAILARPGTTDDKLKGMYLSAFGRPITPDELRECREFLGKSETDPKAWADLAHTLFNVKEFVFIR